MNECLNKGRNEETIDYYEVWRHAGDFLKAFLC